MKMVEVQPKEMKYFIENDKMNLVAGKQPKALEGLLRLVKKASALPRKEKDKNIDEMVL